ncbi:hypothetical protein AKG30_09665 [Lacticaseibacillus paracasei]|nr:hypothetical protein AKG30_09665 [Lacticaseibacillus paracasei]
MFKPTLIVLITILEKWWCDKQTLFGVWFGFLCSISVRKFPKARAGYAAFGVATAKLAHWARLQARKAPAVLKLGLGLGGENHATKTNFSAEPIAAPPALIILF